MKTTCERQQLPDKRILWFVLKKHKYWTWMNANRIADLCATWHTEIFSFFCEGKFYEIMCGCYDIALNPAQMGHEKNENHIAGRQTVLTEVQIELVEPETEIQSDLYPEMDIIIVDRGENCEMIKNKFGELKKFSWDFSRIRTGKDLRFSDFIAQKHKTNEWKGKKYVRTENSAGTKV